MPVTWINARPQPVRLTLSDGTTRLVPAWGLTRVEGTTRDGRPLLVERAEYAAADRRL